MTEIAHASDAHASIAEIIKSHPIVLFMKGSPSHPQCGFSAAVVAVLRHYDAPVHTVDVLMDPALRQGIKTHSRWPTIPQLYLHGALVRGCDIVRELHASGGLRDL